MIARGNAPYDTGRPYNNLLRRLSSSDFALIEPHLAHEEAEALETMDELQRAEYLRAKGWTHLNPLPND